MRTFLLLVVLLSRSAVAQITVEEAAQDPRSIWYSHATLPPVYESSGTIYHVGHNLGVPGEDKSGTANNEKPWLHTGGFDSVDPAKVTIKRLLWLPPNTKIALTNMAGRTQARVENGVQIQGRAYTRISGVFPNGTLVAEFVLAGTELSLTRSRQKLDGEWVTDERVHGELPRGYESVESCAKCHEDIGQHSVDIDATREWYATIRGLETGGPIHWHPFVWPDRRDKECASSDTFGRETFNKMEQRAMKARLLRKLFDSLWEMLTKDADYLMLKKIADDILDIVENRLAESETTINKGLQLAIDMIRTLTGIPDDIDGDED